MGLGRSIEGGVGLRASLSHLRPSVRVRVGVEVRVRVEVRVTVGVRGRGRFVFRDRALKDWVR